MTKMMEEIFELCQQTTNCIKEFSSHRSIANQKIRRAQQNMEEEKKDQVMQHRNRMM
jgi:hypothetical protein